MSVSSVILLDLFRVHLLMVFQCWSMNETVLVLLKQQPSCTCLLWTTFLGNYSHQPKGLLVFLFRAFFFLSSHLSVFCISCQSPTVTFNCLQTELAPFAQPSASAWLLPVQPVRKTQTVAHASYSALAN